MADVNFTGVNTKMGSLITMKIRPTEGTLNTTPGDGTNAIYAEDIQRFLPTLLVKACLKFAKAGLWYTIKL